MARVLVTYGWCRTAYLAMRALAAQGHEVYTCSSLSPSMSGWSRYSRQSGATRDPFEAPEAFVRDVAALVERWEIDLILPGHEDAIPLRRFETLLPPGLQLVCPDLQSLEFAVDKAETTRLAMRAGVPTPRSEFPACVDQALEMAPSIGYPQVVKLRRSNSGKGIAIARSAADVRAALEGPFARAAARPGRFPFLQEFRRGTVVGGCFLARRGSVIAAFGERYLRTKNNGLGTSVFREPFASDAISEAVHALVTALDWDGIGHFDFIEDPNSGKLYLLEMNPRLWGAIHLAYINGFDFPSALVAQTLGESDLQRFFSDGLHARQRSMWLVGEGIRSVGLWRAGVKRRALAAVAEIMRTIPSARFDDFSWRDPLAFCAEAMCYGKGFLRSGGETNPGSEGMFD